MLGLIGPWEVRVMSRSILVYKLIGDVLALGDRVQGEIGDQDPESLISHVRRSPM